MKKTRLCAIICVFALLFSNVAYADMPMLSPIGISVDFDSMLADGVNSRIVDISSDTANGAITWLLDNPNGTVSNVWIKNGYDSATGTYNSVDGTANPYLYIENKDASTDRFAVGKKDGQLMSSHAKLRYEFDIKFSQHGNTTPATYNNWKVVNKLDTNGDSLASGSTERGVGMNFKYLSTGKMKLAQVLKNSNADGKAVWTDTSTSNSFDMNKWYHFSCDVDLGEDKALYKISSLNGVVVDSFLVEDVLADKTATNTNKWMTMNLVFNMCYSSNLAYSLDNIKITADQIDAEPVGKKQTTWWCNSVKVQDFEGFENITLPENISSGSKTFEQDNMKIYRGGSEWDAAASGLKTENGNKYFRGAAKAGGEGLIMAINESKKTTKINTPMLFEFDGRVSNMTSDGMVVGQESSSSNSIGMIKWTFQGYDSANQTYGLRHVQSSSTSNTDLYDAKLNIGQWYRFSALANPITGVTDYKVYDMSGKVVHNQSISGFNLNDSRYLTEYFRFRFGWGGLTLDVDNINIAIGDVFEDENPITYDSNTQTYTASYDIYDTYTGDNFNNKKTPLLVLASYDSDGKLLKLNYDSKNLADKPYWGGASSSEDYNATTLNVSVKRTSDTDSVVLYLWNNFDQLIPLTQKKVLTSDEFVGEFIEPDEPEVVVASEFAMEEDFEGSKKN